MSDSKTKKTRMIKSANYPKDLAEGTKTSRVDPLSSGNTRKTKSKDEDKTCLVMIYGEQLGKRYRIGAEELIIGRSPDCGMQFYDSSISRRHCCLTTQDSKIILTDMESTNGTFVNNSSIKAHALKDGDKIAIGRSLFKFLSGDNVEHEYHKEIYRLMTTDNLTGAYNRKHFEKELNRHVHHLDRYERPFSLIMIDIDHFKQINDTYGHLAGDHVLSDLGTIMLAVKRTEDSLFRYGGEEFATILPETDLDGAMVIAERLRQKVEEAAFKFNEQPISITISLGVAEADRNIGRPENLIGKADACLYAAKEGGRNRVVSGGGPAGDE